MNEESSSSPHADRIPPHGKIETLPLLPCSLLRLNLPPFPAAKSVQADEGEEPVYEVEAIRDCKGSGKSLKYLVKWAGYPEAENMWLFARGLRGDMTRASFQELVDAYEAKKGPAGATAAAQAEGGAEPKKRGRPPSAAKAVASASKAGPSSADAAGPSSAGKAVIAKPVGVTKKTAAGTPVKALPVGSPKPTTNVAAVSPPASAAKPKAAAKAPESPKRASASAAEAAPLPPSSAAKPIAAASPPQSVGRPPKSSSKAVEAASPPRSAAKAALPKAAVKLAEAKVKAAKVKASAVKEAKSAGGGLGSGLWVGRCEGTGSRKDRGGVAVLVGKWVSERHQPARLGRAGI